jgi:hypothetical protein
MERAKGRRSSAKRDACSELSAATAAFFFRRVEKEIKEKKKREPAFNQRNVAKGNVGSLVPRTEWFGNRSSRGATTEAAGARDVFSVRVRVTCPSSEEDDLGKVQRTPLAHNGCHTV